MLFEPATCADTVSIFEAVLLGTSGACIDIGMTSLLSGVALFIGAVILLRFVGATILRRLFPSLRRKTETIDPPEHNSNEDGLQRMPYESPIRSTGAWGSKPR